jgi:dipeptidyl-peptidase 4
MKNVLLLLAFMLPLLLSAQRKMLTMEEAVLGQKTTLAPQKLNQLSWIPETDRYYFVGNNTAKTTLFIGTAGQTPSAVISLKELNDFIKKNNSGDTLRDFPAIEWRSAAVFSVETNRKEILYNIETAKLSLADKIVFPETAENFDKSKKGDIAYTIKNNLFVYTVSNKKMLAVTKEAEKNILSGQSVHREEWGISKGTFWSPKGNLLAFYRMDQTMVTDYPVLDFTKRPASADLIKYPMAGGKSHEVTVGVFNPAAQKIVFLKTGEPRDQYLTNLAWSPDEQHIYIAVLNREQNHLWLNSYSAVSGNFEKTLFEETNEKYVHPMHPLLFVNKHDELFIWQSERDGFNNLYLYKTDGTLVRQLSNYFPPRVKAPYLLQAVDVLGFDVNGDNVFYTGITSKNLLGRGIFSSSISSGSGGLISSGEGTHAAVLSPSGKYLLDTYSSLTVPRTVEVISAVGDKLQSLLVSPDPLSEYKLGQIRLFNITAADNSTSLFCRMILPVDFDSTKKYPVIVYLYAGPNVRLISNTWLAGSDLWYHYMAEKGYIVFTVDSRGSANRGIEFEQATFRNLGTEEMKDQLAGLDFLKSKNYVNTSRLGVFGWSFGGFMTTSMMTRYPGVFKAGVAGGPVIDWSYYEIMYTERYMDTPDTNPQGYKASCLFNYAENLKGKLLLIHGTSDDVVVWQQSILFLSKCIEKNTLPDYFVYPGHLHNVTGKDRLHLFEKITDYFTNNL